jgi:hypothetical protein
MMCFVDVLWFSHTCHHQEKSYFPCAIMCSTWFKMVLNSTWFSTWLAQHMESAHDHMCKYILSAHGFDSTWLQHMAGTAHGSTYQQHMPSAAHGGTWNQHILSAHGF